MAASSVWLTLLSVSLVLAAWFLESWREIAPGPPVVSYDGALFFDPSKLLQPTSEEEVIRIVNQTRTSGGRLRVLGAGHSWSPLAVSNDLLVSLHKLSGVVSVDRKKKLVTVKGGTTLEELIHVLHQHGLALSNLPSISAQTVAGLLATGTHGTGVELGNLATFVTNMRIISGMGKIVQVSRDSEPDLFKAAAVSLGLLGVVTEVTLQCEDAFLLEETTVNYHLNYCIDNYDKLARSADHVKMWVELNSKVCHVYIANRTTKSPHNNPVRLIRNIEMFAFTIVQWIVSYLPTHAGQAAMSGLIATGKVFQQRKRVDYSWNVLLLSHYVFSHSEAEVSVDYRDCGKVLRKILKFAHNTTVNSVVEIRFVKQDDLWLSPNYHRDSCHVTQVLYNPSSQDLSAYFHGYHKAMVQYHGRPHWGKELELCLEQAEVLYPKLGAFLAVRKKMDPHNVFLNDMMTRVFDL